MSYACQDCDATFMRPDIRDNHIKWAHSDNEQHAKMEIKTNADRRPRRLAETAISLVYGDRNRDYGHPADDYERTAAMWSAYLGHTISPFDAAMMMVMLKLSRQKNKYKDDNSIDAHGYILVGDRIVERERGNE